MDPLGDREELGISFDDEPPGVDPDPACVRERSLEHLGHAAARGSGVDVDDRAALEDLAGGDGRRFELRHARRADDWAEPLRVDRLHRNLARTHHWRHRYLVGHSDQSRISHARTGTRRLA